MPDASTARCLLTTIQELLWSFNITKSFCAIYGTNCSRANTPFSSRQTRAVLNEGLVPPDAVRSGNRFSEFRTVYQQTLFSTEMFDLHPKAMSQYFSAILSVFRGVYFLTDTVQPTTSTCHAWQNLRADTLYARHCIAVAAAHLNKFRTSPTPHMGSHECILNACMYTTKKAASIFKKKLQVEPGKLDIQINKQWNV